MTREEREQAIAILENEKKCINRANKNDYCNRDCYNCELVKTDTEILTALDMAIKALQEQADGDLISRQAVIDSIDKWVKNMGVLIALPAQEVTPLFDSIHGLPSVVIPTDRDLMLDITEAINDGNFKAYTEDGTIYLDDGNNRLAVPSAEPNGDLISRQAVLDLAITIETDDYSDNQILDVVEVDDIKALPSVKPQESSRDMKEIEEVINCDADAETKCKMISNILTAKPHYFEEQEPKTGHWIEHSEIKTSTPKYLMFYECSECGDKQCFCKSDIHKKHFCNNCGAKMVEPQESEVSNG